MNTLIPHISVVMATHNRADKIHFAIDAVLSQTYPYFELIIVNDCSSDHTSSVLSQYQIRDQRVRFLNLSENVGPGSARNHGIQMATGKYVAIIDDDDLCSNDRLEKQVQVLEAHPDVDVTFSTIAWLDEHGKTFKITPGILVRNEFPQNSEKIFELLYLESNHIPHVTMTSKTEVLKKFPYPIHPWVGEDWYLVLQLSATGHIFKQSPGSLVGANRSALSQNLMKDKEKVFKAQRLILEMIHVWLSQNHIIKHKALHKNALSNQYIREARYFTGFKGFKICLLSLSKNPFYKRNWSTLFWFAGKLLRKIF